MRAGIDQKLQPYGIAILTFAIAVLVSLLLEPLLSQTIGAFFFIAVILSTYYGGIRTGIVAAILSTLAINYFFIPPAYAFSIKDISDLVRLVVFLVVAWTIHSLNQDLRRSEQKITRLHQQILEEQTLQQRIERERMIARIAGRVRESLNLRDILTTTVEEVRQFLRTDRVIIFQFNTDWKGKVMVESVGEGWMSLAATTIYDPCFAEHYVTPFRQGLVTAKADIHAELIDRCHLELLTGFQVRANLVVPILQGDNLWGLLIAHHCAAPRSWQSDEIDLLKQLATQLGIAIQQASLVEQLRTELRERQRVETALRESEERWQLAITGSNDGIWDHNLLTDELLISPRGLEIVNYYYYEIDTLEKWSSYIHPEDADTFQAALQNHFNRSADYISCEYRVLCKDGHYKWLLVRGQAVWDKNNQPIRVVGSITDISDRKHAEAELLKAQQFLEVDRIKREFISIVSHELRTPLTAIRGSLGLLAAGVYNNKPEKATQMLKVASEQSDRLVRLVNDILDLQRLESGRVQLVMQPCNAADLVRQSVEAMQSTAEQDSIQLRMATTDLPFTAAPDAIVQTLTNLISNAIKFSAPQSCIWIRAVQAMQNAQPCVLFQVQDQGRGIPSDKLETIFERFQQVDASDSRQKGGTGLGLSICRHIVQQHQGQIWVESTEGQGSMFSFQIPISAKRNPEGTEISSPL
jgi:PAS domain S-box-containing protein